MPTELDYRQLLQNAQQCADSVRDFLLAVSQSPQGQQDASLLGMAALAAEHIRLVEDEVNAIWDAFQRTAPGTHEPAEANPTVSMTGDKPPP
jgi:hypothetical protein